MIFPAMEQHCMDPGGIPRDFHLLYTSQFISLSILESLVHLKKGEIPPTQYLLHIEMPDENEVAEISYKKIKKNWEQELIIHNGWGSVFPK